MANEVLYEAPNEDEITRNQVVNALEESGVQVENSEELLMPNETPDNADSVKTKDDIFDYGNLMQHLEKGGEIVMVVDGEYDTTIFQTSEPEQAAGSIDVRTGSKSVVHDMLLDDAVYVLENPEAGYTAVSPKEKKFIGQGNAGEMVAYSTEHVPISKMKKA